MASTETEIEGLLARARDEYAHCSTVTFRLAPWSPPALEACLAILASERSQSVVMVLEGELRGRARHHDLRPLEGEAGWSALRELKRLDWIDEAAKHNEDPHRLEIPDGLAAAARHKCPPVCYTLAYADGRPVGFFNSWMGVGGLGQVEDLFVHPEYRHRGIATALIHHCVAEARTKGAGPVVICANLADTPKSMYMAMGSRPIAVGRQYGVKRQALTVASCGWGSNPPGRANLRRLGL
jgi:GNAT superfamily N-acetyltransferase